MVTINWIKNRQTIANSPKPFVFVNYDIPLLSDNDVGIFNGLRSISVDKGKTAAIVIITTNSN